MTQKKTLDGSSPAKNLYVGGNTDDARYFYHQVRDRKNFRRGSENTGEIYDLVIIGAGLGRLTSAYFYHEEQPNAKILLLDKHIDFGGVATS